MIHTQRNVRQVFQECCKLDALLAARPMVDFMAWEDELITEFYWEHETVDR